MTRHDVKAWIEEFCELAGHEHIHKGLTSRDLTENVEQLQIIRALELLRVKVIAVLLKLAVRAEEWKDLVITARTHKVPAQPTTYGKRLAMFGEDLLCAARELDRLINNYPVRGLKGPVGTQMDLLTFEGKSEKVVELEEAILDHLNVGAATNTVGQVYPRGLDFEVVSIFVRLAAGPSSFAKTLRIMAGHELASEGFAKGQVGSSAMPHKMNSRSCERLNGFSVILRGYLAMAAAGPLGDQWNEGDVSCSVVRRVFLPDSFYAIDGLMDTFHTILNQMEVYPAVIQRENEHYGPSSQRLPYSWRVKGAGREEAHEAIKEHAVQAVRDLRSVQIEHNDLSARLAADSRLGLSEDRLNEIISQAQASTGMASNQVEQFCGCTSAPRQRLFQRQVDISPEQFSNKGCLHIWPNYTSKHTYYTTNSFYVRRTCR